MFDFADIHKKSENTYFTKFAEFLSHRLISYFSESRSTLQPCCSVADPGDVCLDIELDFLKLPDPGSVLNKCLVNFFLDFFLQKYVLKVQYIHNV
jgi:hypothetical protein